VLHFLAVLGVWLRNTAYLTILVWATVFLVGCPKGNENYNAGRKAEAVQDYDTALVDYERALRAEPTNVEYKLRAAQLHYTAGEFHLEQGEKAAKKGDLDQALAEFRKAQAIDPSNTAADQEVKRTMELLAANAAAAIPAPAPEADDRELLVGPPELNLLSQEPINLKMTNDARVVFETIAKLAGLSAADPHRVAERHAGAGAGHRGAGKQVVLEAADLQCDFCGAGQSAKAARRGR
jgi:tetratricopeptide (TPR) repeat protein